MHTMQILHTNGTKSMLYNFKLVDFSSNVRIPDNLLSLIYLSASLTENEVVCSISENLNNTPITRARIYIVVLLANHYANFTLLCCRQFLKNKHMNIYKHDLCLFCECDTWVHFDLLILSLYSIFF